MHKQEPFEDVADFSFSVTNVYGEFLVVGQKVSALSFLCAGRGTALIARLGHELCHLCKVSTFLKLSSGPFVRYSRCVMCQAGCLWNKEK